MVKNPFAKQETQVRSLEEEMATCSSILAWRIPCTEEPGGLQSRDCKELDMTERRTPCCGRAVSRVLGLSSLDAQVQSTGSVVVAHGLSCPTARGISPDGRPDQCPLQWRAGSSPLSPREAQRSRRSHRDKTLHH